MSGPYRERLPEGDGSHTAWALTTILVVSALFRLLDILLLLRWPRLCVAAIRVWARGFLSSPYREGSFERVHAARRAGLSQAELRYGETPVWTARRLLKKAGLDDNGSLLDLGAGRGRVLLAARSLGARARGVELLDEQRQPVEDVLRTVGVELEGGDLREAALEGVTHVWLAWTCMSEPNRRQVLERLAAGPEGLVVVGVTWPVDDQRFETLFEQRGTFTWGPSEVYAARRRPR